MKKLIALLATFIFIVSLLSGTMITASAAGSPTLPLNYQFYDVCYSPVNGGTYVAIAKECTGTSSAYHPRARVYTSTDLTNWTETKYQNSTARQGGEPENKQLIVLFQNRFVMVLGPNIYSSADGYTWIEHKWDTGISAMSNISIETNGTKLLMGGLLIMRVLSTLNDTIKAEDFVEINHGLTNYNISGLGISTSATVQYELIRKDYVWNRNGDATTLTRGQPNIGGNIYDVAYVSKYDKWIVANNTPELRILTAPTTCPKIAQIKLPNDQTNAANFTTVAVDNNDIIMGTAAGNIYFTPHTETVATANTVWNVASPKSNTAAITEKIASIESAGENRFVMLTVSKIYILEKSNGTYKYEDVNEIVKIGKVRVTKTMFNDVALTAIAYSPSLDMYAAVGRDTTKLAGQKGVIYTSQDGIQWSRTTNETLIDLDQTAGQGLTWWEEAGCFLVRATSKMLYSKDGINWIETDQIVGQTNNPSVLASGGQLTISGGKLYEATFGTRKVNVYTCIDRESFPAQGSYTAVTYYPYSAGSGTSTVYCDRVASDGAASPTIFTSYSSVGMLTGPNVVSFTDPSVDWKRYSGGISGTAPVTDVIYSSIQNKFIMTKTKDGYTNGDPVAMLTMDGTASSAPIPTGTTEIGTRPTTIETNNSVIVIGTQEGKLFFAPDVTGFSSWTPVQYIGSVANTFKVQSICKGKNNKFYATASVESQNGSDILIIEADGKSYQRVNALTNINALSPNTDCEASVEIAYSGVETLNMQVIVGIYKEKQLVQVVTASDSITASKNDITLSFKTNNNVTSDCTLKVMVWDSVDHMYPLYGPYDFFQ